MLSVVVFTKNEEKNIGECIKSLLWCDEIIVIDDYSQDRTVEKAKSQIANVKGTSQKLKIFQRQLNNNFSAQRNFGLEKAKGNWVLFVDADERVGRELAEEILLMIRHSGDERSGDARIKQRRFWTSQNDEIVGFYMRREDFFLGRWLKHGETARVKLLRLAKKGAGKWEGKVHEEWKIAGKVGILNKPLLHYPHPTIGEFLKEVNTYSSIRAEALYRQQEKSGFFSILFYPKAKFCQNYFGRLGFLDGMPGLIMALVMSFHSFLVRAKLYVKQSP